MTKSEILAHFKDAKTVRCLMDGLKYKIDLSTLQLVNNNHWRCKDLGCNPQNVYLQSGENDKLAEIVEYHSDAQHKIDLIKLAIKEYPNDLELGSIIRKMEL